MSLLIWHEPHHNNKWGTCSVSTPHVSCVRRIWMMSEYDMGHTTTINEEHVLCLQPTSHIYVAYEWCLFSYDMSHTTKKKWGTCSVSAPHVSCVHRIWMMSLLIWHEPRHNNKWGTCSVSAPHVCCVSFIWMMSLLIWHEPHQKKEMRNMFCVCGPCRV